MAIKKELTGYKVIVWVDKPFMLRDDAVERRWGEAAERVRDSIIRHCDDVESSATEAEREITCEFCGRDWTERSETYNGGCCDRDCEEEDKRQVDRVAHP